MDCIKTCKGRVVYNRKPHFWKVKDHIRISRTLRDSRFRIIYLDDSQFELLEAFLEQFFLEEETDFEFGGGQMGGGGATRYTPPEEIEQSYPLISQLAIVFYNKELEEA